MSAAQPTGLPLTTAQVAEALGISARRVRHLAAARALGQRIGTQHVFSLADVDALRERHPGRPWPAKEAVE